MTISPTGLPKEAKKLPPEAQQLFVATYNDDFAWRAQEAHALKAAWRAVRLRFEEREDGSWVATSR